MTSPATPTYGSVFIGTIINIMLYGIMITQTYLYYNVYKGDKLWIKLYVALLLLSDTLNSAFDVAFLYVTLIDRYGDVSALNYATWVFATAPASTAVIASLVQLFFAWRVKVLTQKWPLVILIVFLSFCQWCGGVGSAIAVQTIPHFTEFGRMESVVTLWLAASALVDVIITVDLVWHLRKHRTGIPSTDDIVNRIIRVTVQTGMLTAVVATIDLILFLTCRAGAFETYMIFNFPLAKLYTNSLMSSLNSRASWNYGTALGRSLNGGIAQSTGHISTTDPVHQGVLIHNRRPTQVFVDVQVESHELEDRDRKKGDGVESDRSMMTEFSAT